MRKHYQTRYMKVDLLAEQSTDKTPAVFDSKWEKIVSIESIALEMPPLVAFVCSQFSPIRPRKDITRTGRSERRTYSTTTNLLYRVSKTSGTMSLQLSLTTRCWQTKSKNGFVAPLMLRHRVLIINRLDTTCLLLYHRNCKVEHSIWGSHLDLTVCL